MPGTAPIYTMILQNSLHTLFIINAVWQKKRMISWKSAPDDLRYIYTLPTSPFFSQISLQRYPKILSTISQEIKCQGGDIGQIQQGLTGTQKYLRESLTLRVSHQSMQISHISLGYIRMREPDIITSSYDFHSDIKNPNIIESHNRHSDIMELLSIVAC